MNTRKKSTTKSTKKRATKKAGDEQSLAVQRMEAARQHAEYTLESQPGADYELAARITLLLTDEKTELSTEKAIERAISNLATTTGVDVTYPTVICETIPAMMAALASGETFSFGDETPEGYHAHLLELLARAEAGEALPDPDELPPPLLDYKREAHQLRNIILCQKLSGNTHDFYIDYLSDLAQKTGVVKYNRDAQTLVFDPNLLPLLYPIMRFRDGASQGVLSLLESAVDSLIPEDEAEAIRQAMKEGEQPDRDE